MGIIISDDLQQLNDIISKFSTLYIVGGYVRDSLLNKKANDIDLTSNLTLQELETILQNTNFNLQNKNYSFGTAIIKSKTQKYEYSTFRKDFYNNGSHYPTKIEFVKDIKIDYLRRDFTINAIYYNLQTNKIIDFDSSLKDLKKKQLVEVQPNKTLSVDGERILRLVKYAVIGPFKVGKGTFKSAKNHVKNIENINKSIIFKYQNFFSSLNLFKKIKAKILLKQLKALKYFNFQL